MKKAWKILYTVLVWGVVLFSVGMMVFTVISVNMFGRNDRAIFGHKMYIVLSDSMSATDFSAGDLVIVKEVDPATLNEGDIIAFMSQSVDNYGQTMTHKIRTRTTTPDGEPGFVTYGTSTGVDDEAIVTYPYVQGKYVFALPKVGSFFTFMRTVPGYFLCIFLPFMLLILYQGINCVYIFRRYRKEQLQELQNEKDEIAAQRRQNEELMAKLMELQAQMTGVVQGQESAAPQMEQAEAVEAGNEP